MTQDNELLIWIDLEMSGLDPEKERILEVATVVTNAALDIIATGETLVVHQSDSLLDAMDEWNTRTHGESKLIDKVKCSTQDEAAVEEAVLAFIKQHVGEGQSPLCGNSIGHDRRFIAKYMPLLDAYLHYRNIDVSSVKELVRRWYPTLPPFEKQNDHTALKDIRESIGELKYYREKIFVPHV